jgi:molybdopterin molybdotransferase
MSVGWEAVLESCLRQVTAPHKVRVSRAQALGRMLAQNVVADRDYPPGNLSMMDGYAVSALSSDSLRVEGENTPGMGAGSPLAPGTTRRIFTGAELPSGATRVVPQELVQRDGDSVRMVENPRDEFVRARGSEGRKDEIVLAAGLRLTAVELAILATVGAEEVDVYARPRVAHLVTGNEVMAHDERCEPGVRIRDSNSDLVAGILRGIGQTVCDHRRVHDDREATCRVVAEMAEVSDVLLISGGASVGDHDHARAALEAAGFRFEAHGLEVRPGKPVGLARRGDQWAVALPGNPVSHLVALHLFVLPLLLALEGVERRGPRFLRGVLDKSPDGGVPRRDTFWSSVAKWNDDAWSVTPCRFLSSGDLFGVAGANSLLLLRAGVPLPQPGDAIYFLSLAPEFSNACPA